MLFIHSQDIEQNPYFDINQGGYSVANLHTKNIYKSSLDLVNDNVHTIFGLILMTIKGRNSVTNLGKTKCTISNVDCVNDKCIYIIWSHSVFLFSRYRAKTKFWHK